MNVATDSKQSVSMISEDLIRKAGIASCDQFVAKHAFWKRVYLVLQYASWASVVANSFCALFLKFTRIPTWVFGVGTFVQLCILLHYEFGNKKKFHTEMVEDFQFMKSVYNRHQPNDFV